MTQVLDHLLLCSKPPLNWTPSITKSLL